MIETTVASISEEILEASKVSARIKKMVDNRTISPEKWVEAHASGTLRKNKRVGFKWVPQYKVERVAWEFGYNFELIPATYMAFGSPITAGDCRVATETGWHLERMIERSMFPGDQFVPAYIYARKSGGKHDTDRPREGVGIFVKQTSAQWVRPGNAIFAFVAEFDPQTKTWEKPESPF